jgi:hypothetical protein
MIERRYHLLRAVKSDYSESIVATDLTWEQAKALEKKLQAEEKAAKPLQTSWTIDIFYPELIGARVWPASGRIVPKRRSRRKTRYA